MIDLEEEFILEDMQSRRAAIRELAKTKDGLVLLNWFLAQLRYYDSTTHDDPHTCLAYSIVRDTGITLMQEFHNADPSLQTQLLLFAERTRLERTRQLRNTADDFDSPDRTGNGYFNAADVNGTDGLGGEPGDASDNYHSDG